MGMLADGNNYKRVENRRNYNERVEPPFKTEYNTRRKKEKYNFNKYGDKPYETELDRRQNGFYESQEFKDIRYRKPVNDTFAKAIIDDVIRLHKPVSGYMIKLLFDEYQRTKFESDQYTLFYSSYISKSKIPSTHCTISNNNLYLLFINNWGDIVPRKVCKEFDLVNPVMCSLDKSTSSTEPDEEEFIRSIAIKLHEKAPDNWDLELDEQGNPDWDGPIHTKYTEAVRSILSYVRSTNTNKKEG